MEVIVEEATKGPSGSNLDLVLLLFKIIFIDLKNIDLVFHLYIHPLVDSCTSWASRLQPWCVRTMLQEHHL